MSTKSTQREKTALNEKGIRSGCLFKWCGGMDLNHHEVAPASPSSW